MAKYLHIHDTPQATAEALARFIDELADGRNQLTMAISGGSTPEPLFEVLATTYREKLPWSAIHLFWVDERMVPPDDAQSNYGRAKSLLVDRVAIPAENVHRIRGEANPVQEVNRYASEILSVVPKEGERSRFDLVLLGMGDDGHTASIFQGQLEWFDTDQLVAATVQPSSGQQRVGLTGAAINGADVVAFLVTGADKARLVAEIIQESGLAANYPAAQVQPLSGELHWFLDQAAASKLRLG